MLGKSSFNNALVWAVDWAPWTGKRATRPRATSVGRADYISVIPVPAVQAPVRRAASVRCARVPTTGARAARVRGVDERVGQAVFLGLVEQGLLVDAVGPRVQVAALHLGPGACAFSDASEVFEDEHGARVAQRVLDGVFGCEARLVKDELLLARAEASEDAFRAASAFRLQALPEPRHAGAVVSRVASPDDEWRLSGGSCYSECPDAAVDADGHERGLKGNVGHIDADVEIVVRAAFDECGATGLTTQQPANVDAAGVAVERDAAAVPRDAEHEFTVLEAPVALVQELQERCLEADDAAGVAVGFQGRVRAGDVSCCAAGDLGHEAEALSQVRVVRLLECECVGAAASGVDFVGEVVARVGEGLCRRVEQVDGSSEFEADGALHAVLLFEEDDFDAAAHPGAWDLDVAGVRVGFDFAVEDFFAFKSELQRGDKTMTVHKDYGGGGAIYPPTEVGGTLAPTDVDASS